MFRSGSKIEDEICNSFEPTGIFCDSQVLDSLEGQVIIKNLNAQQLGDASSRNIYVNHRVDQNAYQLEQQQQFQGMQNQQPGLFFGGLGYNQSSISILSGDSSIFKLQQESDSTTNSERSEITEASTEFCCQRGQQEHFAVQQYGFPQYSPMQQSSYDEMQMLQQQVMLKQLQNLQRQQQQLQQPNFLNPYSAAHRQANNSGQYPPLVDRTPLGDASQGYINWAQRSAAPAQQGTLDRTMLFSMGLGSQQQQHVSLYGSPLVNTRGNMGQQSPVQIMYQDSGNLAGKTTDQSVTHSSILKDQYCMSPAQGSLSHGAFVSDPDAGLVHGLNSGGLSGNLLMASSNTSIGRQEQLSWSSVQQQETKPSQNLVPLDPLEEKILFNMEDSSISDIASEVFGDNSNFSSSLPSIQSGSWSALMQSAVAEASSSDTGVQDEFSGLTYQNMDQSVDNNNSVINFIDSDKQQAGWVNGSLPGSVPFTSESLPNPEVNPSFPGFQLFSDQLRVGGSCQGVGTHGSTPRSSPKVVTSGRWVDCNPQHKLQVQSGVQFEQGHSQTGNLVPNADDLSANMSSSVQLLNSSLDLSQGGKWGNPPSPLGRALNILNSKSQSDNNANQGPTRSDGLPHQEATQQFNVWMDLPTRPSPLDQESSKSSVDLSEQYNVPQSVGLSQAQGASSEHRIFDSNHFPSPNNVQVGYNTGNTDTCNLSGQKIYEENSGFKASTSQFNPFAFSDAKTMNLMAAATKNQNVKTLLQEQVLDACHSQIQLSSCSEIVSTTMQPAYDSKDTPGGQLSSVQDAKSLDTMNQDMVIVASKKRKLMTPAWHEEVMHVSLKHQSISVAGQAWAEVTNRLSEQGEYKIWKFESIQPSAQSKRRLVLTAQLMQQLFCPSPKFNLLSDASSSYDSLLYFVARATLGDACGLTNKEPSSSNEINKLSEKTETFERKMAKELIEKAKKLEGDFERHERTASMADIKFEIEDLERFAVINRFARFHSRAAVDQSLSTMPKPIPQRYIAAVLSLRNLPEGVQCLSL